jgi:hypothetical protein
MSARSFRGAKHFLGVVPMAARRMPLAIVYLLFALSGRKALHN